MLAPKYKLLFLLNLVQEKRFQTLIKGMSINYLRPWPKGNLDFVIKCYMGVRGGVKASAT